MPLETIDSVKQIHKPHMRHMAGQCRRSLKSLDSICNNNSRCPCRNLQYAQCEEHVFRITVIYFFFYDQASKSYAQVQAALNLNVSDSDCHWAPFTDDLCQTHIFPLKINSFRCRPHIQAPSLSCTSACSDRASGEGPSASPPLEMNCLCIHTYT